MWLTYLHQNYLEIGIRLEGGSPAQLQRVGNCHIADLPAQGNLELSNQEWQLFRETFIFVQVTMISDIFTATAATLQGQQVKPNHHTHQSSNSHDNNTTTPAHKELFYQILGANINICQYRLTQPLGAWLTTPTTIREFRRVCKVVYIRNALDQWSSHSCIPQQRQLCSKNIDYSLNGELNVPFPQRHQIVDVVPGRETVVVGEHQLPEIEIQQQITDMTKLARSHRIE